MTERKSTENSKKTDLVRAVFVAWETGDAAALDRLLADDFTFSSPNDDHLSRAEYWETCWPGHDLIRTYDILNLVKDGEEVLVRYEGELTDGRRFRNVEHFRFAGDKVAEVTVYFGRDVAQ
jgi:ketosteroid isomerase-like protein